MKIACIARPRADASPERIAALQSDEARATWDLYQSDFLREMYFLADRPGALVIVEAASVGEAAERLDAVPMAREGIMDWEFIPLKPFPVFGHLFASEHGRGP